MTGRGAGNEIIERLSMMFYGKRELAFHFVTFLLNFKINPSEKKTGEKSHIHAVYINGKRQKWNFCRSREKQTSCLIALMFYYDS